MTILYIALLKTNSCPSYPYGNAIKSLYLDKIINIVVIIIETLLSLPIPAQCQQNTLELVHECILPVANIGQGEKGCEHTLNSSDDHTCKKFKFLNVFHARKFDHARYWKVIIN